MISQEDLYILQAIRKSLASSPLYRRCLEEADTSDLPLAKLLFQYQLVSPKKWDQVRKWASHQDDWPHSEKQLQWENRLVRNQLVELGIFDEREVMDLDEKYLRPSHPSLVRDLIEGAIPQVGPEVLAGLGIQNRASLHSPTSDLVIEITHYCPWRSYPCPLSGTPLIPIDSGEGATQTISHQPSRPHDSTKTLAGVQFEETAHRSSSSPEISSLGRYKILTRLGEGGMGAVYRAYDPEMDREVALKVITRDRETSKINLHRPDGGVLSGFPKSFGWSPVF